MDHNDHVRLLRDSVHATAGAVWADLGSGSGAFTFALAELLGPDSTIYSIDRNTTALREQERQMRAQYPQSSVRYLAADFSQPLDLPPLDGMVMANSLHFLTMRQKETVVPRLKAHLKPGGRLVLVEYNVDQGNPWVPHPLSYTTWEALARRCGFTTTQCLATQPSRFLKEFYVALSQ